MADDDDDDDADDFAELAHFFYDKVDLDELRRKREAMDDWSQLMWAIRDAAAIRMADPTEPPCMLGRYEALDTVQGGMGMVVIGRDPLLNRKVAIKLWKTTGPEAEAALLAEANILGQLSHPNIVGVYDVGKYKSSVYFVMQSVDGMSGHDWMHTADPSWQEVRDVFVAAGSGLAAAHDADIHHRDFKPANMLVGDDGRVLILDFGIADTLRSTDGNGERQPPPDPAVAGAGTVTYMAPERLRGERGDARSDQFSFCVAMWKALYRVRPYPGESPTVLLAAMAGEMLHTGPWDAEVPSWLSEILRKGLAYDPDSRYRNMHELVAALRDGPAGDEPGDGDSANVALSGATGWLLNAPPTSGASGQSQRRVFALVWTASVASGLASAALVLAMSRPSPPVVVEPSPAAIEPAPVVTVEEGPLDRILAHVERDEFGKAEALWKAHRMPSDKSGQGLSDADSLALGRACLERGLDLELADARGAEPAGMLAREVAVFMIDFGNDDEAKQAGHQLHIAAKELIRRLPAHGEPTQD